jgi:hypothetical protein
MPSGLISNLTSFTRLNPNSDSFPIFNSISTHKTQIFQTKFQLKSHKLQPYHKSFPKLPHNPHQNSTTQ